VFKLNFEMWVTVNVQSHIFDMISRSLFIIIGKQPQTPEIHRIKRPVK